MANQLLCFFFGRHSLQTNVLDHSKMQCCQRKEKKITSLKQGRGGRTWLGGRVGGSARWGGAGCVQQPAQAAKAQISQRSKGTATGAGRNQTKHETLPISRRALWRRCQRGRHSPSLANDAEALLCLQRGTNSCGSMGSLHWDKEVARRRGLCGPTAPALADSSWSLLTASREKVRPFSWRGGAGGGQWKGRTVRVGTAAGSSGRISTSDFEIFETETEARRGTLPQRGRPRRSTRGPAPGRLRRRVRFSWRSGWGSSQIGSLTAAVELGLSSVCAFPPCRRLLLKRSCNSVSVVMWPDRCAANRSKVFLTG